MVRTRFFLVAGILAVDVLLQLLLSLHNGRALPPAALLAAYVGFTALFYRNARVDAAPVSLVIRNAAGIGHVVAPAHIHTVVLAEKLRSNTNFGSEYIHRLFVLDDEGRAVLRWSANRWTLEQMLDLISTLGVTIAIVPETLSTKEFRARYPRALAWPEAHPVVTGLIFAILVVAATTLVILDPLRLMG